MGAFAALAFSEDVGADLVIAAAPQVSIEKDIVGSFDTRWADHAEGVVPQRVDARERLSKTADIVLLYDPLHREDRRHVQLFEESRTFIKGAFPLGGHEILGRLSRIGALPELINSIVGGDYNSIKKARIIHREARLNADYLFALGERKMKSGQFGPAARYLAEALSLEPDNPECCARISDCLWRLARYESSIVMSMRCVDLRPESGFYWVQAGIRLVEVGRLVEAEAFLVRGLLALPDCAPIYNSISIVQRKAGDFISGVESLRRAVALMPHMTVWADELAVLDGEAAEKIAGNI